jgi:hypothetical protein
MDYVERLRSSQLEIESKEFRLMQISSIAGLAEHVCSKIVVMGIEDRLASAIEKSPLSARKIAAEMTARGCEVSHTTVNRWNSGSKMPRLDEAAVLALDSI